MLTQGQVVKRLEQLDAQGNPVPMNIKAVSFDISRKKGGKLKQYEQVTTSWQRNQQREKRGEKSGKLSSTSKKSSSERPTKLGEKINLTHPSGVLSAVHLPLIIEIDGQSVVL